MFDLTDSIPAIPNDKMKAGALLTETGAPSRLAQVADVGVRDDLTNRVRYALLGLKTEQALHTKKKVHQYLLVLHDETKLSNTSSVINCLLFSS